MDRIAITVLVLVALVIVGMVAASGLADTIMKARQTEANRDYARAALEEAHLRRDREANTHRETMFQMWTVSLMAFSHSNQGTLITVSVLLGLIIGGIIVAILERRYRSAWNW